MNVSESEPDPFRAGFTVAFAIKEAAQLRDQEQHLVELRLCRLLDLSAQLRAPNFVGIAEWFDVQIAADSAHTHQISDPPSRDEEQRQGAFEPLDRAQLQGVGTATVLQHIEQNLDFPAGSILVRQSRSEQRHRHFRRRKHVTMFAAGVAFVTPRDRFAGFEAALPVAAFGFAEWHARCFLRRYFREPKEADALAMKNDAPKQATPPTSASTIGTCSTA